MTARIWRRDVITQTDSPRAAPDLGRSLMSTIVSLDKATRGVTERKQGARRPTPNRKGGAKNWLLWVKMVPLGYNQPYFPLHTSRISVYTSAYMYVRKCWPFTRATDVMIILLWVQVRPSQVAVACCQNYGSNCRVFGTQASYDHDSRRT